MKFTIKNLQNADRKVPLPGGKTVPIKANGTVVQVYPQGLQAFFKALSKIGFEVKMEATGNEKLQNAKFAVKSIKPAAPQKPVQKKEEPKPVKKEEAKPEVKAESAPAPEQKKEEKKEEAKPAKELTKQEIIEKCRELAPEQLKEICDKLNISTNSTKVTTLVGKISNSEVSDADLRNAFKAVVK